MIVCPGGGYRTLAPTASSNAARWLAAAGVTSFILRYRLGPVYRHPVPLMDAARALRLVRSGSPTWGLDPQRVGMLGFSAGGHLATTLATHFNNAPAPADDEVDHLSARPDLHVAVYSVITMGDLGQRISRQNLLGDDAPRELLASLSNETQVTRHTPPAFLMHSTDDKVAPAWHSDLYAAALLAHGVPFEYVRGPLGPHAAGITDAWSPRLADWLRRHNFITAPQS